MSYEPRTFWDQRLSEQFDLRGTGETGLSLAYNRACYALRREVLTRALSEAGFEVKGKRVLDVGCGTGFFTAYYLDRGAHVTGLDIAPTSVERLRERHTNAQFLLGDVSETEVTGRFGIVNAFDVLYHVTDDARWAKAVRHLARAVDRGGLLLMTDTFAPSPRAADHNRMRALERYREILDREGIEIVALHPTHLLLNSELGPLRFMNRLPGVLLAIDKVLLALGAGHSPVINKLMVARRKV